MLEFKFIYGSDGYNTAKEFMKESSDEVGINESFTDSSDKTWHFVGYDKGRIIAAAGMYLLDERNVKIAFVSVCRDYRRQYVGDLIMKALADKAVAIGCTKALIEAPVSEKGFFEFEGYKAYGSEFENGGKPYIMMSKDLTVVHMCSRCKD